MYSDSKKNRRPKRDRLLNRIVFGVIGIALLIILVLIAIQSYQKREIPDPFWGTYVYDEYTEYVFDKHGRGIMRLEGTEYPFTYEKGSIELYLIYDDQRIKNSLYHYTLEDDKLTIVGKTGTTGGTYVLYKK